MNVLIIDDEDLIQFTMAMFLTRYGERHGIKVEVTAISDPVQGLFEITNHSDRYDLILLDLQMPKLSGDEIFKSMLRLDPQWFDKVIFFTGNRPALEARFPDQSLNILDKPCRYADLEAKLDALLNH